MTKNTSSEIGEISFESAVRELEAIVNQMETNQLPLQDALNAFKHGTALLQQCQKTLADVEQQVRILSDENQLQNHQDKQE
jgi:exodeoxyribonuclease VII, small subunit